MRLAQRIDNKQKFYYILGNEDLTLEQRYFINDNEEALQYLGEDGVGGELGNWDYTPFFYELSKNNPETLFVLDVFNSIPQLEYRLYFLNCMSQFVVPEIIIPQFNELELEPMIDLEPTLEQTEKEEDHGC